MVSRRRELVYKYCLDHPEGVTNRQVREEFSITQQAAARYLNTLVSEGRAVRSEDKPGMAHTYTGIAVDGIPVENYEEIEQTGAIGANQMYDLLVGWSNVKWNPKIFKSAKTLPLAVAELYNIAARMAYGEVVRPEELTPVFESVNVFKRDLEAALRVVYLILNSPELRSLVDIGEFLLEGKDVTVTKELVQKVLDKQYSDMVQ